MLLMNSAMRCSFFRMSAASWASGSCVMSCLAQGARAFRTGRSDRRSNGRSPFIVDG